MTKKKTVTFETVGLDQVEYDVIVSKLGREPNETELRLFGVMWSEHCSYKSTRHLLKQFNQQGKYVIGGDGENAGLVRLNDDYALAFKIESHNHPCAVEPYQGAATGVGGIIRDILTMGAYPIASMDGLFFGVESTPRNKEIQEGVIGGVGGYGNCIGIPTVGGKTIYDKMYAANPLLNAFCIGLLKQNQFVSSKTAKPNQHIVVLGSHTGRDGIAGAAFASVNLSEDNAASRSNIQIGDPFAGKKLIDCVHELLEKNTIACMQDMGAAGIISSTSEVALKSGVGMEFHFDHVHCRASDMTGWEIALSESQERMLLIIDPDALAVVKQTAEKWDVGMSLIGKTTNGDKLRMYDRSELVAELSAELIGGNAPIVNRTLQKPKNLSERQEIPVFLPEQNYDDVLQAMLSHPSHREKSYIWKQYDSEVQLRTIQGPGAPVSIMRVTPIEGLIAMCMECDPYKCYTDPYNGAAQMTALSLRNLAVCGADVMALTDCLNFPSPEFTEQYWEIEECIRGMADVSHQLNAPVISGNVSLYNQTGSDRIFPSPNVVSVGRIENEAGYLPSGKATENSLMYVAGKRNGNLGACRYSRLKLAKTKGMTVPFDAGYEKQFFSAAMSTARNHAAISGRAVAGGGLLLAAALECIHAEMGLTISIPPTFDLMNFLMGEGIARAIYAVPEKNAELFENIWKEIGWFKLGKFGGDTFSINSILNKKVSELKTMRQSNP